LNILYLLIPLGLILVGIAIAFFFWAVGAGQFDDLDSPAMSVIMDDDTKPAEQNRREDADETKE
jgi:cbb3-type cytochrome oxidase maturation protein